MLVNAYTYRFVNTHMALGNLLLFRARILKSVEVILSCTGPSHFKKWNKI